MAAPSDQFDDTTGRSRILTGLLVVGGLGVSILVGMWALGHPDNDPVVETASHAWTAMHEFASRTWPALAERNIDLASASLRMPGADPETGRNLISRYGCGSCHVIPGVSRANGSVGPGLDGFSNRAYVAGILPNRPGDLTSWLIRPTAHAPETAMPDLGLSEEEARHIAAYLYTLGDIR